jgi:Ca-activated chloride channel homolog
MLQLQWMLTVPLLLTLPGAAYSPRFRAEAGLVQVNVSVSDANNRLTAGLQIDNFQVFDSGVRQEVKFFTSEDTPISVGLVVDASSSMADRLAAAKQAAARFLRQANPEDEIFLETFNDRAEIPLNFTNRFEEIQNRVLFQTPRGRTGLLDAVVLALQHMRKAANRRRVLLLITDGAENASRYSTSEVTALARESDVAVYSIGAFDRTTEGPNDLVDTAARRLLQDLAAVSGGRVCPAVTPDAFSICAEKIAEELHHQYVLGYYSSAGRDGKYHRLKITVTRRGDGRLWWTARPGYFAR